MSKCRVSALPLLLRIISEASFANTNLPPLKKVGPREGGVREGKRAWVSGWRGIACVESWLLPSVRVSCSIRSSFQVPPLQAQQQLPAQTATWFLSDHVGRIRQQTGDHTLTRTWPRRRVGVKWSPKGDDRREMHPAWADAREGQLRGDFFGPDSRFLLEACFPNTDPYLLSSHLLV